MAETPTLLIVDDSPTQRALLEDAFVRGGFRVLTAHDGIEAMHRAYEHLPDLIVSDVLMPELNGYHLCRLLKTDPATARIPIILLTQLQTRLDRFWGQNAGADRYLEKTGDLEPLLATARALLEGSADGESCPLLHVSAPGLTDDPRARITGILDRLLLESTISNEILKLTRLVRDPALLAREFLALLADLCGYSVAGLLLREGRDRLLLVLRLEETVAAADLQRLEEQILAGSGWGGSTGVSLRREILHPERLDETGESPPVHLVPALPIRDSHEWQAGVAIGLRKSSLLNEGTRQVLNLVADRFLVVARYLNAYQESEEVKADFVSMLVHDLRAPLTSIRGFADMMTEGLLGPVRVEQREAAESIQRGSEHLLGLINDILDISRLEAGKMQLHPMPLDLPALVESSYEELSALFLDKEIPFQRKIPPEIPLILGDGRQLVRVLLNLLGNAVKFNPSGKPVACAAGPADPTRTRQPDRFVQVTVTDHGRGIPRGQQERLFLRYQQVPTTRMFRKGTGLGLAICREIVHLHGGEIWVESPLSSQGGTSFHFTLPVA